MHYDRKRRLGTPYLLTTDERFWTKVEFEGPLPERRPELGPCWLWLGKLRPDGYGRFGFDNKLVRAHRFSYVYCVGPIPAGTELDHLCRVSACVNPEHLEAVTHQVNILRGDGFSAWYAITTICPSGHVYDKENTYVHGQKRFCRACHRIGERTRQREVA